MNQTLYNKKPSKDLIVTVNVATIAWLLPIPKKEKTQIPHSYTLIGVEMQGIDSSPIAATAWRSIIGKVSNYLNLVCFSELRLFTTNDFVATNGSSPLTKVGGFSPWRCLVGIGKILLVFMHVCAILIYI